MPDRFFTSNFDTNVLMQWIIDTRQALMGINSFDPKIIEHVLTTKTISKAYELSSEIEISKHTTDNLPFIDANANSIVSTNIEEIQSVNNNIASQSNSSNNTFLKIRAAAKNANIEALSKDANINTDINNPIPINDRIDSNSINKYGDTQEGLVNTYLEDNAIFSSSKQYNATSEIGYNFVPENKTDLTKKITDSLLKTDTFNVVTGYKSKTSATPPEKLFKSWVVVNGSDSTKWTSDGSKSFYPDRPYSDYADRILQDAATSNDFPGTYKFFIEKLHGRYSDGTPYKMNGVTNPQQLANGNMNLTNRMVFSAYIDNYNDSYTVNWGEYNLLGRADPVPSYKSTTREMVLEFTLMADFSKELMLAMDKNRESLNQYDPYSDALLSAIINMNGFNWGLGQISQPLIYPDGSRIGGHIPGMYSDTTEGLWSKITFLSQCCYPFYRDDGKMKEQPIIRMRIADFYDVIVYLKSFQIQMTTFDGGPMVDISPSVSIGNIPVGVKVTMSGTVIHNHEPSSTYCGFYNRREYDKKELFPETGTNLTIDTYSQIVKKNSPTEFGKIANNAKLLGINQLEDGFNQLQNSVNDFQKQYDTLKQMGDEAKNAGTLLGVDIKTKYIKQQTNKALKAQEKVNKLAEYLRKLQGYAGVGVDSSVKSGINFDSGLIPTSPINVVKNIKEATILAKDIYNQANGIKKNVQSSTKSLSDFINNDLSKLSDNVLDNITLDKIENVINGLQSQNKKPKTIGDMLEKTGSVDYSQQTKISGTTSSIDPFINITPNSKT